MILGLDRSHQNTQTPLQSLVAKGVKFMFFKGTQGTTYEDPTFNKSWQEAKNTPGLIRGVYHFFSPQQDGIEQAQHFISLGIDFNAPGCLPPVVDIEDDASSNSVEVNKWIWNNYEMAIQRANDFINHVETAIGKKVIVYSYNNYLKQTYRGHSWPDNPMWLSSLQDTCPNRFDTHTLPDFWQWSYSWLGTGMDANYFTGTQEQLNSLANIG